MPQQNKPTLNGEAAELVYKAYYFTRPRIEVAQVVARTPKTLKLQVWSSSDNRWGRARTTRLTGEWFPTKEGAIESGRLAALREASQAKDALARAGKKLREWETADPDSL